MREASVTLMGLVDFMDPISGHMFLEQFWGWYFLRVPHANIGGGSVKFSTPPLFGSQFLKTPDKKSNMLKTLL